MKRRLAMRLVGSACRTGTCWAAAVFNAGDMIPFDRSDAAIPLQAGPEGATFVLGSAVPHPYDLVLGYYSVHSSEEALKAGEVRIAAVRHLYACWSAAPTP